MRMRGYLLVPFCIVLISACLAPDELDEVDELVLPPLQEQALPEVHRPGSPRILRTRSTPEGSISYEVVDGEVVLDGDMLMGPVEDFEARFDDGDIVFRGVGRDSQLWGNMPIRYSFDDSITGPMETAIEKALYRLVAQSEAAISFRECSGLCIGNRIKFRFEADGGCSAYVGRQALPIANRVNLDEDCDGINDDATSRVEERGRIMHEVMHALGVYHEQSRCDRDDFVTINWDAIDTCNSNNFAQCCSDATDYGEYDYSSIMHYPSIVCNDDHIPVITAPDPADTAIMGQRENLSVGDREVLIGLYGNGPSSEVPGGLDALPLSCDQAECEALCGGPGWGTCISDSCACY